METLVEFANRFELLDSIGPIRNGNPAGMSVSTTMKIQSDRYGMETSMSVSNFSVSARFNRTDTEWKLSSVFNSLYAGRIQSDRYGMETPGFPLVTFPPRFNRTDTEWKRQATVGLPAPEDSIGPIRNGNSQPESNALISSIQSDRYGMETFSKSSFSRYARFNRTDTEWKPVRYRA